MPMYATHVGSIPTRLGRCHANDLGDLGQAEVRLVTLDDRAAVGVGREGPHLRHEDHQGPLRSQGLVVQLGRYRRTQDRAAADD